jgi:DNA repair exonuclease SbcCD ATPase subunit
VSKTNNQLKDDVDALFKLPLADFTTARNSLAARLKKDGRANDANLVKTFAKPSISAWAVNQLYWEHGEDFEQLLATGQRLRQAQTSRSTAKIADMRASLDARRDALNELADLAGELLREAGHNPTPDTIHRITTTLEALSAYASQVDGPTPGRLTQDIDPPGFDSLGSFSPSVRATRAKKESIKSTPSRKPLSAVTKTQPKVPPAGEVEKKRRLEEARRVNLAAAKLSVQDAKRLLTDARPKAVRLQTAQKKAQAEAKQAEAKARQAEKRFCEAEADFRKAGAESEKAAQHARQIAADAASAADGLEDAMRAVEKASKELESLFRGLG